MCWVRCRSAPPPQAVNSAGRACRSFAVANITRHACATGPQASAQGEPACSGTSSHRSDHPGGRPARICAGSHLQLGARHLRVRCAALWSAPPCTRAWEPPAGHFQDYDMWLHNWAAREHRTERTAGPAATSCTTALASAPAPRFAHRAHISHLNCITLHPHPLVDRPSAG